RWCFDYSLRRERNGRHCAWRRSCCVDSREFELQAWISEHEHVSARKHAAFGTVHSGCEFLSGKCSLRSGYGRVLQIKPRLPQGSTNPYHLRATTNSRRTHSATAQPRGTSVGKALLQGKDCCVTLN